AADLARTPFAPSPSFLSPHSMSADTPTADTGTEPMQDPPAPACVMTFNASDASGAGGVAGDVATIAAMGAHALPVVTSVLVRNHQTLTDFLLPEWEADRPASPRELAVAAAEHGARYVLVTSVPLPDQFVDNVLASAKGPVTGEKFERFEVSFVGAGDTLSAALAALLAAGSELSLAVGESLAFLDQALDAGFRPGMGNVIPDRFFWALPPGEEEEQAAGGDPEAGDATGSRQVH